MSINSVATESRTQTLKNESARQRWKLFHRAIAHAKESNLNAMEDQEADDRRASQPAPLQLAAR